MSDYVKRISAEDLYGRFGLTQDFEPGVNVIHGKNGTGKTTLLHLLANVLNSDYYRFAYLPFSSITVILGDDTTIHLLRTPIDGPDFKITVMRNDEQLCSFPVRDIKRAFRQRVATVAQPTLFDEKTEEFSPILAADYFPAFRTMIEAWATLPAESLPQRFRSKARQERATLMARDLFGSFVPDLNYPSPIEIETRLTEEITNSIIAVARSDQELLSRTLVEIFSALFTETARSDESPEKILDQIRLLAESLEASPSPSGYFPIPIPSFEGLRQKVSSLQVREEVEQAVIRILNVYRETLLKRTRIQKVSYEDINNYLNAVNEFLDGKSLQMRLREESYQKNLVRIIFDDGQTSGLETLSSGERQIVTLIYAATHMRKQRIVLIDEPELSLHIDWQRSLLNKMAEQLGDRQIIACTHSPVIGADYQGHMKELTLQRSHTSDELPSEAPTEL